MTKYPLWPLFLQKSLALRYIDKESRFPYAESRVFDRRNYEEKEYENWYSVPIYGAAVERKVKGMTGAWNEGNEEAIG